ncbi:MAG: hypothetical protein U0175_05485 [Caldilineaceae bacterium]
MLTWVRKQQQPQLRFELQDQQMPLVDMEVDFQLSGPRAVCKTANSQFQIAFDGFWRHKVFVRDGSDMLIALVYAETWFSDTSILRVGDKTLYMKFRNNPLTELIIYEVESKPLLTCRLAASRSSQVEVHEDLALRPMKERETLLGIAWFLFFPIAQESKEEYAL